LNHYAAPSFWSRFNSLPEEVQDLARDNYKLLVADPWHPSLHFKRVGRYWSVRVGAHYRALGKPIAEGVLWGWIGTHAEYDRLIR
jgi:glutamate-1-semialdehyde aminotransferase